MFPDHVDHVITKVNRGLLALKTKSAMDIAQPLLIVMYKGLVIMNLEYACAVLTVSHFQIESGADSELGHGHNP